MYVYYLNVCMWNSSYVINKLIKPTEVCIDISA